MNWLIITICTAFLVGISDVMAKFVLKGKDPYVVALGKMLFSAPLLLSLLFFIKIPALNRTFWLTMLALVPMEIGATILYMKGVKASPVALSIPFMSFTPVFIILTGFLFLREVPTLYGTLGIVLVVAGAYILNISDLKHGFFAPFRAIFREKGSRYILIVALIYAFTSVLGKVVAINSSPIFIAAFYVPFMTMFMLPITAKKAGGWRGAFKGIFEKPTLLILLGVIFSATEILHFKAITMIDAAYMISVKRTSIIIATLTAYLCLKEKHILAHLAGTLIMFAGVVVITLFG